MVVVAMSTATFFWCCDFVVDVAPAPRLSAVPCLLLNGIAPARSPSSAKLYSSLATEHAQHLRGLDNIHPNPRTVRSILFNSTAEFANSPSPDTEMADRGHSRGGRGGGGGGGGRGEHRSGRGGGDHRGGRGGGGNTPHEKPKKENILDLSKYMDKRINVKFNGGREGVFLQKHTGKRLTDYGISYWDIEGL